VPGAAAPEAYADDLAALIGELKLRDVRLVAQSMGGWTGMPFALAHPERTAALVLAGTPGGVATPQIAADGARVPQRIAERGFRGMALGKRFLERYQKFRSGLDEAARRQFDRAFGA